ncbi:MAG: ubiquinol oxidase subunit II [Lautropia sp.]|nr:ubiquinol oxidase subunit II [Lautropia sp.]
MKLSLRTRLLSLLTLPLLLSGCDWVVFNPSGYIAQQQRDLILISTGLMLLVIIPVICLTLYFAWKYRASNVTAEYEPDWHHSTKIEVVVWTIPVIIIAILATLTWITSYSLDPFKKLDRIDANRPVPEGVEPLEIHVVAMDWKWLFIYPEEKIALVNEVAAPVDRPVLFKMTASNVMNTFYIPTLAGMIYAMPGMESHLNAVINKAGDYWGLSGNYGGAGHSGMKFTFRGLEQKDYDAWVEKVRSQGGELSRERYLELNKPSQNVPVQTWASVDPEIYPRVRNRCIEADRMCSDMIAAIDEQGSLGLMGLDAIVTESINEPAHRGELKLSRAYVSESLCAPAVPANRQQALRSLNGSIDLNVQ